MSYNSIHVRKNYFHKSFVKVKGEFKPHNLTLGSVGVGQNISVVSWSVHFF